MPLEILRASSSELLTGVLTDQATLASTGIILHYFPETFSFSSNPRQSHLQTESLAGGPNANPPFKHLDCRTHKTGVVGHLWHVALRHGPPGLMASGLGAGQGTHFGFCTPVQGHPEPPWVAAALMRGIWWLQLSWVMNHAASQCPSP